MTFTATGIKILNLFKTTTSIKSISKVLGISCNDIRVRHFKYYRRRGYLKRVCKFNYILSEEGRAVLRKIATHNAIKKDIAMLAKDRRSNSEIIHYIEQKYGERITNSAAYHIISRLRKKHGLPLRNKIERRIPRFSKKLSEFIGLVFSDGGVSGYEVFFSNRDQSLLNRFQDLSKHLFNVTVKTRIKPTGVSYSYFTSIDIVRFIRRITHSKTKLPDEILYGPISHKQAFLKSYFSGDGCAAISISYKKTKNKFEILPFIGLACRRRPVTEAIANMLKSLGCKHVLVADDGIRIQRKADMQNFYKNVGFIKGSKIRQSKYWRGYTKNQILKFIVTALPDSNLNRLATEFNKDGIATSIKERLSTI